MPTLVQEKTFALTGLCDACNDDDASQRSIEYRQGASLDAWTLTEEVRKTAKDSEMPFVVKSAFPEADQSQSLGTHSGYHTYDEAVAVMERVNAQARDMGLKTRYEVHTNG